MQSFEAPRWQFEHATAAPHFTSKTDGLLDILRSKGFAKISPNSQPLFRRTRQTYLRNKQCYSTRKLMLLFDKVLQKYYRSSHTSPVCLVMYPSLNLSAEFARLVELIRRRHLSPPVTPGIPSQPSPLCTSWLYCPAFQVQRLSLDYVVHVCGSSATFPRDGARETDLSWWGQVLLGSKANQNLSKNV